MTILLHNASCVVVSTEEIRRHCDVLIEGKRISRIGPNLPVPDGCEVIDVDDCAVLPGLINPHTHLYQNFAKGASGGVPLVPWCNEVLFPTVSSLKDAARNNPRIPYLWTALATIEMIHGGITCCINMDTIYPQILYAWQDAGFRGVLAYTLANRWIPAELRGKDQAMREQTLKYVAEFHHPDGLTQIFMAPSTIFLCDDACFEWVREQSDRLNLGVQIHVSETSGEVAESIQETGLTPVERLEHLGLLNERLSAVHCVHLNSNDISLLAKSGAVVVHCPKSNMKLADGIAPLRRLSEADIPIAVATDGCASNDLLDEWEEMRAAILLARVSQDNAGELGPAGAFRMATQAAARAARIEAGELTPGKLADVIVVELQRPHLQPFPAGDLINLLVFCARAGDVRDTIIDGKVVMRDRRLTTLDEAEILQEAVRATRDIFPDRAGDRLNQSDDRQVRSEVK